MKKILDKGFDEWNEKKKMINLKIRDILPNKKQVWWLTIGLNVGAEEDGKSGEFERPVLVIKVFNRQCFLGIPITSANKNRKKYYFPISYNKNKYFLILSQIRLFSSKRLSRKIYKIGSQEFLEIKKELKKSHWVELTKTPRTGFSRTFDQVKHLCFNIIKLVLFVKNY